MRLRALLWSVLSASLLVGCGGDGASTPQPWVVGEYHGALVNSNENATSVLGTVSLKIAPNLKVDTIEVSRTNRPTNAKPSTLYYTSVGTVTLAKQADGSYQGSVVQGDWTSQYDLREVAGEKRLTVTFSSVGDSRVYRSVLSPGNGRRYAKFTTALGSASGGGTTVDVDLACDPYGFVVGEIDSLDDTRDRAFIARVPTPGTYPMTLYKPDGTTENGTLTYNPTTGAITLQYDDAGYPTQTGTLVVTQL